MGQLLGYYEPRYLKQKFQCRLQQWIACGFPHQPYCKRVPVGLSGVKFERVTEKSYIHSSMAQQLPLATTYNGAHATAQPTSLQIES